MIRSPHVILLNFNLAHISLFYISNVLCYYTYKYTLYYHQSFIPLQYQNMLLLSVVYIYLKNKSIRIHSTIAIMLGKLFFLYQAFPNIISHNIMWYIQSVTILYMRYHILYFIAFISYRLVSCWAMLFIIT